MRHIIIFVTTVYMLSLLACSAVKFSKVADSGTPLNPNSCPPTNPCTTSPGIAHIRVDTLFNASNKVDILMVDDNSLSMNPEQHNMALYFQNFVNTLNAAGLDWQIGVTNTDVCAQSDSLYCFERSGILGAQGAFMGPLGLNPLYGNGMQYVMSNSTPNVAQVFSNTVQRGNQIGSGDERGIYAANLAISGRNSFNAGFFRDNSNLALVILSDEDERSNGGADPRAPLQANDLPETLVANVSGSFSGTKKFMANSIIIEPGDVACFNIQDAQPQATANYGNTYARLSQLTNGAIGSICNDSAGSFGGMLTNIAGAITRLPDSLVIVLPHVPMSTPQVSFSPPGNSVPYQPWSAGQSQIVLLARPPSGTTVSVDLDYQTN